MWLANQKLSGTWFISSFILATTVIIFLFSCQPEVIAPTLIQDSYVSVYPPTAFDKQMEGTVVLLIRVDQTGAVTYVRVHASSGHPVLDSSAMALARTAKFHPGKIGGVPQELWMTWPIIYRFASLSMNIEKWQREAFAYHKQISGKPFNVSFVEMNLFSHYVRMANYQSENRNIALNPVILEVVNPDIRKHWEVYEEKWPLPFLLLWDYIQRLPNSSYAPLARDYLMQSIAQEIDWLNSYSGSPAKLSESMKMALISNLEQLRDSARIMVFSELTK